MRSVTYTPRLAFSIQLRKQSRAEGPGACPHIPGAICPPFRSQKAREMAEVVWLQPDGTSTLHPFQQSWVKTADNKQIYQERYLRGEIFTRYPQYVFLDMTSRAPGHASRGPGSVRPASAPPTPSLLKNTADWRHSSLCIKKQKCLSTVGRIPPRNSEELCQFLVCVLGQRLATSLRSSRAIRLGQSMFTHRKEGDVTQISKSA